MANKILSMMRSIFIWFREVHRFTSFDRKKKTETKTTDRKEAMEGMQSSSSESENDHREREREQRHKYTE